MCRVALWRPEAVSEGLHTISVVPRLHRLAAAGPTARSDLGIAIVNHIDGAAKKHWLHAAAEAPELPRHLLLGGFVAQREVRLGLNPSALSDALHTLSRTSRPISSASPQQCICGGAASRLGVIGTAARTANPVPATHSRRGALLGHRLACREPAVEKRTRP
ncbi:MAG: hypothetical protein AAF681_01940 [Pseudomonadota bacterium]